MLAIRDLGKHYETPAGPLPILIGLSLDLTPGDAIAVMGPSGSGKSTLLHLLGALDRPSSGSITLDGKDPFTLNDREQAAFRNSQIGFVFQDHSLLAPCTVLENVLIPTLVAEGGAGPYEARARDLLKQVGLGDRIHHLPGALSGGEKQRTAIARALIRQPRLLLCDEPTGNLDAAAASVVAGLLLELHGLQKSILIAVTHSTEFAARFPRRFCLQEQRLQPC